MSFSYSIDADKKLAHVTFPENGSQAEILEVIRQLMADERLGQVSGVLVDVRATSFAPSAEEARAIVSAILEPALVSPRPAAVVVSQPVQYGMGNMISILAGLKGAAIRVFYNMETAEAWLQLKRW
jgi:hypothetical protein